jgi:hypothetical protein
MSQIEHKECFGKMFPDDLHLHNNEESSGKVFGVLLKSSPGIVITRTDRSIKIDIEQWDECRQCPEFDSCYKLCLAKVTLESAIVTQ